MIEKRMEGGVSIDIFSVCWSDDRRRDRRDILSDSGEIRIEFMYQVVRLSVRKGPCRSRSHVMLGQWHRPTGPEYVRAQEVIYPEGERDGAIVRASCGMNHNLDSTYWGVLVG